MMISIIVFPGSNCDKDIQKAIKKISTVSCTMVWHRENKIPSSDLIIIPGGFSFGDYLRGGAIAANSPIIKEVKRQASKGVPILGICNGFQILTEAKLLPGTLMMNSTLKFICKPVEIFAENKSSIYTKSLPHKQTMYYPIAHKIGNYQTDKKTLETLMSENRIAFRYGSIDKKSLEKANPNGSKYNIAGVLDKTGKILGMMPHPERSYGSINKNNNFFESLINNIS